MAYVLAVAEGSPGATIGLERGDALAQIDGRSTRSMPLWQIQTALAGEPGTELELEVIRRGQSQQETLTLGSYSVPGPRVSRSDETPILRLSGLEAASGSSVENVLKQLVSAGESELLLDLRGVAGGSSEAAYEVADLFVDGDLGS